MSKVVAMRGGPVVAEATPNAPVISLLEEYLERARSGDVQGVVFASLHSDDLCSYSCAGAIGGSYGLVGAVTMALDNLVAITRRDDQ